MKKAEWKAINRRARMASRAFSHVMEGLEKMEPNWAALTSLEIARGALHSLRHYLEDEKEPDITWKEPFVELHFPVEWSFEEEPFGPTCGARIVALEDLKSDERPLTIIGTKNYGKRIWPDPESHRSTEQVQWLQLLASHCRATSLLANPVSSEVVARLPPLEHQRDRFSVSTPVPSPIPLRGEGLARFETSVAERR